MSACHVRPTRLPGMPPRAIQLTPGISAVDAGPKVAFSGTPMPAAQCVFPESVRSAAVRMRSGKSYRVGLLLDSLVGGGAECIALNFAESLIETGNDAHIFVLRNQI